MYDLNVSQRLYSQAICHVSLESAYNISDTLSIPIRVMGVTFAYCICTTENAVSCPPAYHWGKSGDSQTFTEGTVGGFRWAVITIHVVCHRTFLKLFFDGSHLFHQACGQLPWTAYRESHIPSELLGAARWKWVPSLTGSQR